nr:hypothetical protein [uncultured Roseateles sp.]
MTDDGFTTSTAQETREANKRVKRGELVCVHYGRLPPRYFSTQAAADAWTQKHRAETADTKKFQGRGLLRCREKPTVVMTTAGEPIITAATKFTACPSPEPRFKAIDPPLYAPRVYR